MELLQILGLVLSALLFDTGFAEQRPATFCQCPCESRVAINKDLFKCMTILSVKTGGYLTADEHYVYIKGSERYVFVTDQNKLWGTGKWKVVYNEANDRTYSLKNEYVKEWLHTGTDQQARDAFRRYTLTQVKGVENVPPRDGYWQFIPDPKIGKDVYRIRNAFTGEFLYVDDEKHDQRNAYNRAYLWRHVGHYQNTDNRHWFKLGKC